MSEQPAPEQPKPSTSDDPLTDFALYARSKMGPFGRYPYASAFLAIALLMTLTRDCMRRVPEPPPVLGPLAPWSSAAAEPLSSASLAGRAYLLQLIPLDCAPGAKCQQPDPVTVRIAQGLFHTKVPVPVIVMSTGKAGAEAPVANADLQRAVVAHGDLLAVAASAAAVAQAPEGSADGDFVRLAGKILLVDQEGRLRGLYALTGEHAGDEAYHRARHVFGEKYDGPFGAGCGGFER
ncbi:MAG: hypothetical protein HQ461_05845 [Deltaproteobacteria bacterium]|nr:hypothetical protein [Deltaproteobacteria bacterium]